ncbi:MAG: DUF3365 domain-containing protein [Candidatus Electrothrix sp. AR3]|nr:DUF3365 domain-containing protein [Candidatus Electrothrix sp. AR3]
MMAIKYDIPTGKLATLNFISLVMLVFWSAVLTGLLYWAVAKEKQHVLQYAQLEARASFNKDIALRNWVAERGGIYVQVSDKTPVNPYLEHVVDRDIKTSSGKELTLMNPAYMLRQTMNEFSELYGIKGRITSLKPFNPLNTPDPWEMKALRQFEKGVNEVSELSTLDGAPYLRYMQAFYTKEGCLKCHEYQGYEVGDVRGGIGVSVPLQPYINIKKNTVRTLRFSYGIVWLLGLLGIVSVNRFTKGHILKQYQIRAELAAKKEQLELVLEGTGLGLWDWNPLTDEVIFDARWANMLGYELSEIEPNLHAWKTRIHPEDLPTCLGDIEAHVDGKTEFYSNVHRLRHKDGSWRYILDRGRIVERDLDNRPVRFTGSHTDITKLKEIENALLKKTKEQQQQATELERLNEILSQQARYDGLTNTNGETIFDIAPVEDTQVVDLDERKLHEYWSSYYSIAYLKLEEIEQHRLLLNADILVKGEEENRVSVGGMLLFGREPQRRLPQSAIVFAVFDGLEVIDDLLDKQEIVGTLSEVINQAKAKIRTFLPRPATFSGLRREEYPAISDKVIREALVNAVCHRDYSIATRRTTIYIFRDRLEITSPGRLPNTLNVEKILTGNSAPRNNFILKYLDNMKFIDGLGRGVPMMRREMGDRLQYQEEGEILRLILYFATPLA